MILLRKISFRWKTKSLFYLLYLALSAGCIYSIFTVLNYSLPYPTITEVRYESLEGQLFPAMTICSTEDFNKSEACLYSSLVCPPLSADDLGTVYKIEVLRRQGTIFASQYELEKFGFMFKDMIKFCRLGVESTCSFQKYYHPVNGLCYILNSRWNESNYVQKILPVEKENETFIDDSSSFVFIIKFDSRNYLRAPGAIITFHHPEEAADFLPHYFIGPGELHEFRLFQSIYHHLPAPYDTSCTDYNKFGTTKARKLRITENGCYAECISNVSLKMCDCVFLSFDYIQRKPDPYARYTEHPNCPQSWTFEDPFPLSCVAGSARGIKRKFSLDLIDCFSNCTVPCRKILYSVKLRKNSLSARHQRQFPEDLKSENRSSLAVVRVKMENRNQKVHITHPKHQWFHSVNQVENIVLIWAVLTVLLNVLERKVIQLQNKTPKSVVEPMVEPEDF